MKKTAGLLLLFGFGLLAAEFWQKPYTEWSEKDAAKMMTNSPWAKSASVSMSGPGGGRHHPCPAVVEDSAVAVMAVRRAVADRNSDLAPPVRGPLPWILWLDGNPHFRSGRRSCVSSSAPKRTNRRKPRRFSKIRRGLMKSSFPDRWECSWAANREKPRKLSAK